MRIESEASGINSRWLHNSASRLRPRARRFSFFAVPWLAAVQIILVSAGNSCCFGTFRPPASLLRALLALLGCMHPSLGIASPSPMPPCSTLFGQLWPGPLRPSRCSAALTPRFPFSGSGTLSPQRHARCSLPGEVLLPTSTQRPTGQLLELHSRLHPLVPSLPPPPTSSPYPDQPPHPFPVCPSASCPLPSF